MKELVSYVASGLTFALTFLGQVAMIIVGMIIVGTVTIEVLLECVRVVMLLWN